ncbi:hypothetical protein G7Z17_g4731 [Cylindrodendrum hubeiense]|uniref:AB hydrolase-1 domain-containing protein n=1 Tax=Cylindrodendrum hubeiense TaxID=595255 RepID=A0A9P5H882_9HYPO|nr:hypothetical protein G7Z17_g4731 [Cylindrodendrum hubeiense]
MPAIIAAVATVAVSSIATAINSALARKKSEPPKLGISTLHVPPEPDVEIVLVHGLETDSRTAWADDDKTGGDAFCWPSSELPASLAALGVSARIVAYDYDSKFRNPEYLTRRTLLHQAESLVEALTRHRQRRGYLPIVFVCHSLGGLLVKNALVNARAAGADSLDDISKSIAGIVFLGTPHDSSPLALADSLCRILPFTPNAELVRELRERSTTLAYSLERFKPLAAHLFICDVTEASSTSHGEISSLGSGISSQRHKSLQLPRQRERLCKFSNPQEEDLRLLMASIGDICLQAAKTTFSSKSTDKKKLLVARREVPYLGMDMTLAEHCASLSTQPITQKLEALENYFASWTKQDKKDILETPLQTHDRYAWPVAILQGHPGCGKTDLALRYIARKQNTYGSILWVNAASRKSLELSFQGIARRIVSHCSESPVSAASLLGLEEVGLDVDKDLDDQDFSTVVQAVSEWLTGPHERKWLLVLDGLSPELGYPAPTTWTGQFDQSRSRRQSWRELLRTLPSTASGHGHIVISTSDKVPSYGSKVIRFTTSGAQEVVTEQRIPFEPTSGSMDFTQHIKIWWNTAPAWEQRVLALTQFLADKNCPHIPLSLLEAELEGVEITRLTIPGLKHEQSHLYPSNSLLDIGPQLLSRLSPDLFQVTAKRAAERAWEILGDSIGTTENRSDLIFAWDSQAQVVQNIKATLRRCLGIFKDQDVSKMLSSKDDKKWADLASICEGHAEYATAGTLYQLERQRQTPGTEKDFSLQLDCARAYQHSGNYPDAEAAYENIFSTEYKGMSFDGRLAAYRQFASMQASQGKFSTAIDKLSTVLAIEDKFGDDASRRQVTESVTELATYLAKDGNQSAASALLQRMLVSLEDTRGPSHPATLSIMEALSNIKLKEGELGDARRLLNFVYDCQKQRLGDKHPSTVLCGSKIAATWDLEGRTEEAEAKYSECLEAATESLGARHPAVFSIREDFVRCLLTLGKRHEAEQQLKKLKKEVEDFPGLYPDAVTRRINRLLDGNGDVDDFDMESLLVTRTTLGVGGFYADEDEDDEDDYDDEYASDDTWCEEE